MTRALAITAAFWALLYLAALAGSLLADPIPLSRYLPEQADSAQMERAGAYAYTLTYYNSAHKQSRNGAWPLTADGLTCTLEVLQTVGPEEARVTCPDGWQVEPSGLTGVEDGRELVFVITRPAF